VIVVQDLINCVKLMQENSGVADYSYVPWTEAGLVQGFLDEI